MAVSQPLAVIAGNYRQYVQWCAENKTRPRGGRAFYATPESVVSRTAGTAFGIEVARTGTWQWRDDLPELEARLQSVIAESAAFEHVARVVFVRDDLLYRGECNCGARQLRTTVLLASDWVDEHGTQAAGQENP